jgi:hypothetical protein
MYDGTLHGVRLRGAFAPEVLAAAVVTLEEAGPERQLWFPDDDRLYSYGILMGPTAIDPRGPSLDRYLAGARASSVWDDASVPERLAALFGVLGGARPVEVPTHPRGTRYAWSTVRVVEQGARIPMHCDTYEPSAVFAHLDLATDRRTQLSWYVPLTVPDAGGELVLLPTRFGDAEDQLVHGRREQAVIPLEPGDLLVFDGGRHYHEITPVRGPRPRRTLGGFAGRSTDGSRVLFWG